MITPSSVIPIDGLSPIAVKLVGSTGSGVGVTVTATVGVVVGGADVAVGVEVGGAGTLVGTAVAVGIGDAVAVG